MAVRTALGIAVALVAARAAADPSRTRPPCPPTARVHGEPQLVTAIAPLLRERGIVVLGDAPSEPAFQRACRFASAEVASGGSRIMVWVNDSDGRRVERLTEDVTAAATIIESWARGDLVDPLLAARATPSLAPLAADAAASEAPAAPGAPRFAIGASGDGGVSGDGAAWTGARVQGCAMLGRFCAGAAIRYAFDLGTGGDTRALDTTRRALDLSLHVELPVQRGRVTIAPGAGVGQTTVTARLPAEDEVEQASALHVRAAVGVAYRVAARWSVRIDLALDVAPTARERLGEPDGIDRQLAASPRLHAWLGAGVLLGGAR